MTRKPTTLSPHADGGTGLHCALIRGFPEDRATWSRQVEAYKESHPAAALDARAPDPGGGGPGPGAEEFADELCALLLDPAPEMASRPPSGSRAAGDPIQPFVPVHPQDRTELYSHSELCAFIRVDPRNELDEMSEPQRFEKDLSGPG